MVSRCVQDVQLVDVPADAVELAVKVLDGGRVLVIKALVQKPRDDGSLAHLGRAEHDHAVAVFSRDVKVLLGRGHFLDHDSEVWCW